MPSDLQTSPSEELFKRDQDSSVFSLISDGRRYWLIPKFTLDLPPFWLVPLVLLLIVLLTG